MIDLDAIRARASEQIDPEWLGLDDRRVCIKDRRALLRYVDELLGMREEVLHYQREFHRLRDVNAALRAAARKVRCADCEVLGLEPFDIADGGMGCLSCYDLRALLAKEGEP